MAEGTVLRSHAGGYLVFLPDEAVSLQCQARKRLKKERVSILTGDRVELADVDIAMGTAVITGCRERFSVLTRPPLANVDQVVIVQAVRQPEWNQLWCDRYIVHFQLEVPESMPILCFNKCDLIEESQANTLRGIYEQLGYRVVLLSAKTGTGMERLCEQLLGKITVFAGPSGVGKSSILNKLEPSLNLKIGVMDHDFGVGRQTTTYSKLYQVLASYNAPTPTWVADTPGFNLQEIRYPMPMDVMWQFPEIAALSNECKFSNCLHIREQGCKVLEHVVEDDETNGSSQDSNGADSDETGRGTKSETEYDGRHHSETNYGTNGGGDESETASDTSSGAAPLPISRTRYENYVIIVAEAQEVDNYRRTISTKVESSVKMVGGDKKGKNIPRLSNAYRTTSRRKEKQKLSPGVVFDDEVEGEEESNEDV